MCNFLVTINALSKGITTILFITWGLKKWVVLYKSQWPPFLTLSHQNAQDKCWLVLRVLEKQLPEGNQ